MRRTKKAPWKSNPFFGKTGGQRRRLRDQHGVEAARRAERLAIGSGLPYKGWGKRSRVLDTLRRLFTTAGILWRRFRAKYWGNLS